MIHQRINRIQESEDLPILFEEIDDGLIQSGELLIRIVLTGIMRTAAVEDISAAITGFIDRQALLKGEGVNRY